MKYDGHDQNGVDKRVGVKEKSPVRLLVLGHQEKRSQKLDPQQKDEQQS
jgi:hypothetical protein